ncbi:DUF2634 domain-containing protein [Paenibacillus kobensis]|uniref:DUF2634 domain-containing protein n=1 Tax=Paenibacillus kobensis TaxID=59841 RepID=UPI000FDB97D8|nr:DUF2634 domain-containing protein [Paenibacillus kobensis]
MIPLGGQIRADSIEFQPPSLTWKLDFDRGRVVGMIDGMEAVKQAVRKALQTDRFAYLIYDADYGNEMARLIGNNPGLVRSELRRRIRETLMQDDRIRDIADFTVEISGDIATAVFSVVSVFGDFKGEVTTHV